MPAREADRLALCIHLAAHGSMCAEAGTGDHEQMSSADARCAKSGKMGAASPQAFQDGVPHGSERACLAHRRYASEQAGGNVHREAPEQPNQYIAPPYWRNPAADAASDGDAYESSALVAREPYGRITSALEGSNKCGTRRCAGLQ